MIRRRGNRWVVTVYNPLTQGKLWIGTFDTAEAAQDAEAAARIPRPGPRTWGLDSKGETECRNCGEGAEHLHHIIPRNLLPSHTEINDPLLNGLPLCGKCHRGWHNRATLISTDIFRIEEIAFALGAVGPAWLEANYPGDRPVDVNQDLLDEVRMLRAELRRAKEGQYA